MTVAVLHSSDRETVLDRKDVSIETSRGSGPGGQHRNKTETLVVATHLPTGITARIDGRSQYQNKEQALRVLGVRVREHHAALGSQKENQQRRSQIGGGRARAFTWTEWRDQVVNHTTGTKFKMSKALKGNLDVILEQ